jgi:pimeloyl-ACP methyl ester carboxylesterase
MIRNLLAAAVSLCAAAPALAQSEDARNFGAREALQQVSLSPDGARIAMIVPTEGPGSAVLVAPTDGSAGPRPILSASGKPDRLTRCSWSTATRLMCSIFIIEQAGATKMAFTRLVAIDADGSNLKQLSARPSSLARGSAQFGGAILDYLPEGSGSAVLMERSFVPEVTTGTLIGKTAEGLGVERVDTVSLKRSTVEQPKAGAVEYLTDGHGAVRIQCIQSTTNTGYSGNRLIYSYRRKGRRDWEPLSDVTITPTGTVGFVPVAVDRDLDVAYGYASEGGRSALYRMSLDGSLKRELVFQHAAVDVDSLVRIGRQRRVIGVSYATETRRAELFDPQLRALSASLGKALPGLPIISFVDATADEQKLLLFAGSDTDPGRYYLLDRKTKKLAPVEAVRPQLAKTALATVKPMQFPAADGTMIPGYLTLPAGSDGKNLPAIVMPHGGPGSRDEWGFDWLPQFFAARGFAVLQPNFRGSSGYGEAWFQKNGFQSWRTAVGDVNDGGKWLLAQGIAAPGKLAVVGWSYGGYAALQSPVLAPDLFKAIVAIAPVTDLETLRRESEEFTNYKQVDAFIGRGAHVREGSPAQNAGRIRAPVLLFHGDQDLNVGVGESRLMAARLKDAGRAAEYVEFDGLDHQLDDTRARTEMLDKSDAFLRRALGLPARP